MTHTLNDVRKAWDTLVPLFLLIDPLLGEPLPLGEGSRREAGELRELREAVWQRPVTPIVLAAQTPLPPEQHPYLVELQSRDDVWMDVSWDMAHMERAETAQAEPGAGTARRIGGWLQSSQYPEALAAQLALMMKLRCVIAGQGTYLRLADPRVFEWLRHVIGHPRVAKSLGRIQNWSVLDAQGQLSRLDTVPLTSEELQADEARGLSWPTSLLLSWEEWQLLSQGPAVQACLTHWVRLAALVGEVTMLHRPEQELLAPVRQALYEAERTAPRWPYRLVTAQDWPVWAALCLVWPVLRGSDTLPPEVTGWLAPPQQAGESLPAGPLHQHLPEFLRLLSAHAGAPFYFEDLP